MTTFIFEDSSVRAFFGFDSVSWRPETRGDMSDPVSAPVLSDMRSGAGRSREDMHRRHLKIGPAHATYFFTCTL